MAHHVGRRAARGRDVLRALGRAVHGDWTIVAGWRTRSRSSRCAGRRTTSSSTTPFTSVAAIRGASVAAVAATGSRDRLACRRGVSALPHRRLSGVARRVRPRNSAGARGARGGRGDRSPPVDRGCASIARACCRSTCSSPDAAREHLEAAYGIAQRLGSRIWIRWTAAPLAMARAADVGLAGSARRAGTCGASVGGADAGDDARAAPIVELSRSASVSSGSRAPSSRWLSSRPELALEIVDARLASERAANPDECARRVPRLSLLRAEALSALGRYEDAERALEGARREAAEQGAQPMLWRIEAALGHVHRLQRRRLEARRAFDTARAIADELAAKIPDDELRTRFSEGLDSLIPSRPRADAEARREGGVRRSDAARARRRASSSRTGRRTRRSPASSASASGPSRATSRARWRSSASRRARSSPAWVVEKETAAPD